MYFLEKIEAGKTIFVHKKTNKRIGAKERTGRKQPTKEEIEKINQRNAERKLAILLNANFKDGDYHLILTYRRTERPTPDVAKEQVKKFLRDMRKVYQKQDIPFKYVQVTEYKKSAIHHHLVIENCEEVNTSKVVKSLWKYGNPNFTLLNTNGQYKLLAEYLIKETSKTFREKEDKAHKQRYSCSRNLVRPKPVIKVIKANSWLAEPKIPKGYYLDKDSLINAVDKWTGREYQRYILVKLAECG